MVVPATEKATPNTMMKLLMCMVIEGALIASLPSFPKKNASTILYMVCKRLEVMIGRDMHMSCIDKEDRSRDFMICNHSLLVPSCHRRSGNLSKRYAMATCRYLSGPRLPFLARHLYDTIMHHACPLWKGRRNDIWIWMDWRKRKNVVLIFSN